MYVIWHRELDGGIQTPGIPAWRCSCFTPVASIKNDDRIAKLDARVVREVAKLSEDISPRRRFVFENRNVLPRDAQLFLKILRNCSSIVHCTSERPNTIGFISVDTYAQSKEVLAEKQSLGVEG